MTTTTFASLPLDVIEKVVAEHLPFLHDVASARLSGKTAAACGARPLAHLGRAAKLARSALCAHRTTLLLRRGLVGHVLASDEFNSLAEEEAEEEAEAVALLLVVCAEGPAAAAAGREARRLRRERRRAEAEALRSATDAALAAALALVVVRPSGKGGGTPLPPPHPSPPPLLPPLAPPMVPSPREAGARLASLLSLSPDPVVDLLAAAHHATSRAGDHPPLMAPARQLLYLAAKRERVTASVRAELAAFVATCAGRLWESEQARQDEDEEEDVGADQDGEIQPMEEDDDNDAGGGGGEGGAGAGPLLLLSSVVLLPQKDKDEDDDEDDEDDANNADDTANSKNNNNNNNLNNDNSNNPAATTTIIITTTADASVQTTGGGNSFGPSLSTVQELTREVLALAARTSPETMALLERCLVTELRAWEGLPTPLP